LNRLGREPGVGATIENGTPGGVPDAIVTSTTDARPIFVSSTEPHPSRGGRATGLTAALLKDNGVRYLYTFRQRQCRCSRADRSRCGEMPKILQDW
jgi:hypothetical protein